MAETAVLKAPAGSILAAWSQIVGAGKTASSPPVMVARFIIQGTKQNCGSYVLQPDLAEKGIVPAARSNPDPLSFPLTLCQAQLPAAWAKAQLMAEQAPVTLWMIDKKGPNISFSGPHSIGRKHKDELVMVTLGDTGCRDEKRQPHCSNRDADWPFNKLINTVTSAHDPDFIIHAGDYRYYQEGHSPDSWPYWYQDFFLAAQKSLLNTAWVFSRGNHEQCHNNWAPYWYGTGWFYFFEATSSLQTRRCPEKPQQVQVDPWYFDVAIAGLEPFRFIMIDTAPSPPKNKDARGRFTQQMRDNFTTAIKLAENSSHSWWVTHRPLLSLSYYRKSWHYTDEAAMQALQLALKNTAPLCQPRCSVNTILSGHNHLYQKIEFFAEAKTSGDWVWPQTVIVGNGGVVDVNGLDSSPCKDNNFPFKASTTGVVRWNNDHGFVSWHRSASTLNERSGWSAEPYFLRGGQADESPVLTDCKAPNASPKK